MNLVNDLTDIKETLNTIAEYIAIAKGAVDINDFEVSNEYLRQINELLKIANRKVDIFVDVDDLLSAKISYIP